jgi:hypothetical protein
MRWIFALFLLFPVVFLSCNSNEIGNGKDVDPQTIFFDYKIWGEEGDEDLTVMLQYRFAGPGGTTLVLEEPSKVELDGIIIPADSSKMTGAFYEVIRPVNNFKGKHTIVFIDMNKKKYEETFEFQPLVLKTEIPPQLTRNNLMLELEGVGTDEEVRLILSDTSNGDGINKLQNIRGGKLFISREDLGQLVNGPVHLEIFKEVERPVKNGTLEGGRFALTYGLKREFILKN